MIDRLQQLMITISAAYDGRYKCYLGKITVNKSCVKKK